MPSRNARPAEEVRVDVMGALDLALDVAFHDGAPRELAVAAEAYMLAGYDFSAIDVSHGGGIVAVREKVNAALFGRPRRLLKADARGMLTAFTMLAQEGIVTHQNTSEARRQRWLARGGHDR